MHKTNFIFEIASLPDTWGITSGLQYPTTINLADGTKLDIPDYRTHHTLIQVLIKGTEQEKADYINSIKQV